MIPTLFPGDIVTKTAGTRVIGINYEIVSICEELQSAWLRYAPSPGFDLPSTASEICDLDRLELAGLDDNIADMDRVLEQWRNK